MPEVSKVLCIGITIYQNSKNMHSAMHNVHCTLSIQCTIHGTVYYTVHCTLYSVHATNFLLSN